MRLEGWPQRNALLPSFETPAAPAPQDEVLRQKAPPRLLTTRFRMPIVRRHERPFCDLRHLPGDYRLASAGCGRLFSSEMNRRPASGAGDPSSFVDG